jgi:hypothetical protein
MGRRDYSVTPGSNGSRPYITSVQLGAAYNQGSVSCGTSATPTAKVRFLSDAWDASGASPSMTTDVVAYYLVPVGTVSELHRLKCTGSTTVNVVVAHNVDPATVQVSCSSTCDSASVPQTVTLSFTVTKPSVTAYPITLTGQRRQT